MPLLGRDTWVKAPSCEGILLLETMSGMEELGVPYVFQLGLLSENPSIDPDEVLGKPLAVGVRLATGGWRCFHGMVTSFAKTGATRLHTRYTARLNPFLSEFAYTSDCRVFNETGQNVVSIATSVLAEDGLFDLEASSIKDHVFREREYCVQYNESDLHFVARLLEEEGIYYFFRHEEGKHVMVLADAITAHDTVTGYERIPYAPKERQVAGAEEHFWGMTVRKGLYPGRHTVLRGYDPTELRPGHPQFGKEASGELEPGAQFEHYDNPGGLFDPREADSEAEIRVQADRVEHTIIEVEGNTLGLGVGDLVSLHDGRDGIGEVLPFWHAEDFGKQYLIVGATYHLSIDQYESGSVAGADEPFRATYQILDSRTQYRPRRTVGKPRMPGPQTALVVGPAGKEIWTDSLGRVMVQFDWDRIGKRNEKSSCWIRVAQAWAGARWGAIHIPRIGQEVIVDFLDGDPDRPLITGRLYNADNMPPYELPANATQSGIKSRSSPGGTGQSFNEIRFEDKKGEEELHIQAEKDMSTLVKHCQTLEVGVDRDIVVGNDETTLVKGNRETTVKGNDSVVVSGTHDETVIKAVTQIYADDHFRKVDGDQTLAVEKNKNEHVKLAYTLTTDEKFQLWQGATSMTFAGTNVEVDSKGTITLKAGGAVVTVDQAGKISMTSKKEVTLMCMGSALSLRPDGITVAAASIKAGAAGGASKMEIGKNQVEMKSKTVNIEAETTCSVIGKSVLKLNTP
jgi:type VI secretion system secreted protein VgrG